MSYHHVYHADNHADVFKYLVLARVFALSGRKDTPYAYLDSHSEVGLYDLQGGEASRTGEQEQGIARPWEREGLSEQLDDYLDVIRRLNPDGSLRYYPDSLELVRRLTRAQDRVLFDELHPEDDRLLKASMVDERWVTVHQGGSWLLSRAFLPAPEKRAVLLIDPPSGQVDGLQHYVAAPDEAIGRARQTVVVIWYLIKGERQLKRFYQALERNVVLELLCAKLRAYPVDGIERFSGSGLAVINPSQSLEDKLCDLLLWLTEVMIQSQGGWRLDRLVAE